jgi:hypothetical protein
LQIFLESLDVKLFGMFFPSSKKNTNLTFSLVMPRIWLAERESTNALLMKCVRWGLIFSPLEITFGIIKKCYHSLKPRIAFFVRPIFQSPQENGALVADISF